MSGYDDESVIPRSRLKFLLGQFEDELNTIQRIFTHSLPKDPNETGRDFSAEFWGLRSTAEELGSDYSFLIDRLIDDYESFKTTPNSAKLEQLFLDVKSLQLLLTG